ncbi:MAG: phosphatidylglycerol lysyltransferase domain-containing protein [Candidatus Omnitrophota bacterium]
MQEINIKDKPLFDEYFSKNSAMLSTHSFASIFIWKRIFKIFWQIIDGCLCVFARNGLGCFLIVPPLGKPTLKAIKEAFKVMDSFNKDNTVSRIENIQQDSIGFYKDLNLELVDKDSEYLYTLTKLANLSGSSFKSKRSSYNFFIKHYQYSFERFNVAMAPECLALYQRWMAERKAKYNDEIYNACLEDSETAQELALKNFNQLQLGGWVVKVDNYIKGYSIGFALNKDTFCILFETVDLRLKGLSQFIFKELCRNLNGFKFVNTGDDSGFMNLKQVKLSYKPVKLLRSFIAQRATTCRN